jgi:hypothetical protein
LFRIRYDSANKIRAPLSTTVGVAFPNGNRLQFENLSNVIKDSSRSNTTLCICHFTRNYDVTVSGRWFQLDGIILSFRNPFLSFYIYLLLIRLFMFIFIFFYAVYDLHCQNSIKLNSIQVNLVCRQWISVRLTE